MWTTWGCCLLGVLLATGTCLECELCSGLGTTCIGVMRTCGASEDTCVVQQIETLQPPVTVKAIMKGCGNSSVCRAGFSDPEISLGNGMRVRMKISCCTGDSCQTDSPPELSPPDVISNGLQCPGCFGMFSTDCWEQPVVCTGSQNKCIDISANIMNPYLSMGVALKGCANEAACDHLKPGNIFFGGSVSQLTKATCNAASAAL